MDRTQLHFFAKEASKSQNYKQKLMAGGAALGAGIAGVNEYRRSKKNKQGLTKRDIKNRLDDLEDKLTDKQRSKIGKDLQKLKRGIGKSMDENREIAIPAKALLGAGIGAYAVHRKLKRP